ncbi:GLUCAN ENDO-13-BETA-GLUCOSIDASE BG1-RELATED-RELATED [Salix koriyanagi]|uniref:glucan endo-1,3-beta-D-glucosidase n=1 Tax=Salix koriyanagi TaxID=2511006 RepID=A0A9Q0Z0D9_9ROSI|nr:GLUCAN ENDO-13-BETA-GLUCOSIDASE BG1-RELATED-RELATED [Salix koriyanagi]
MAFSILILLYLLQSLSFASSQSFIGVNYGQVADNLPPPSATAKLLQSTAVQKVRLYGADPAIIKALANTGIGILTPSSKIILITVGNEVLLSNDQNLISQLLPAMQNMQKALNSASLGGKVKVSTVHSMAILSQSDPPSAGLFNPANQDIMRGLLQFQKDNGSPISVNPYPFFAYQSDRRPETLAFCLFQPNSGRVDSGNGIKYMNMFDAQVRTFKLLLITLISFLTCWCGEWSCVPYT